MSKHVVTLDVREDLKRGREPFSKIMRTAAALNSDEDLLLIAPFEPAPLYGVLGQQGFSHEARSTASGDWEVLFSRTVQASSDKARKAPKTGTLGKAGELDNAGPTIEVDARGLEPPEPLVKILEALAALPDGARLRARTDRRPMHLYERLEEQRFTARTQEEPDGSFVTIISRS